jgi:hypothetical protein
MPLDIRPSRACVQDNASFAIRVNMTTSGKWAYFMSMDLLSGFHQYQSNSDETQG